MGFLEIIATSLSMAIIAAVVSLIRSGRLMERYALIWLGASSVLLVFSLWRGLLEILAGWFRIHYPPAFLFLAALGFLLLLLLHLCIVVSDLTRGRGALVRELALLREELHRLRTDSGRADRS